MIDTKMATKVNYDDNLFYLTSLVRTLQNGLQLDIDSDYFKDKTIEDIVFLDGTIQQIYEGLRVNTFLINRKGHLRELMRVKRAFAEMIGQISAGDGPFKATLAEFSRRLEAIRSQHLQDITDIQGLMETRTSEEDPHNIVSQDEYRFLFQNDEPEA